MSQVDKASLTISAGGENVTGQTLSGADGNHHEHDTSDTTEPPPQLPPDFPPESFFLSKEAELDWIDRNAYIERKDSGKGGSSAHCSIVNPSSSQRFSSIMPNAAVIGLPKPQKYRFAGSKNRRNSGARLFIRRSGSTGRTDPASLTEPASPAVSCIGRVRSRRDRERRLKNRQWSNRKRIEPAQEDAGPEMKPNASQRWGFLASFRCIFG